jgi:organic radical activating enzyme
MSRPFSPETTSGLEGPPVPAGHAFITEMFSGIQGEGPLVGVRQVFVRFGGCDLRCWWCDTPGSLVRRGPGRAEVRPGAREFRDIDNPLPLADAKVLLRALAPAEHHSVTFTGGEPLLQPGAVATLGADVRAMGGRTWLETHGGRVLELESVIDVLDLVSMDIKLRSSSGDFVPLDVHRQFLEIARATDVYVKVVITPDTDERELLQAAQMVAAVDPGVAVVLQPVTPFGRVKAPPSPDQMLHAQTVCLGVHPNVRVIPQTHKLMSQL